MGKVFDEENLRIGHVIDVPISNNPRFGHKRENLFVHFDFDLQDDCENPSGYYHHFLKHQGLDGLSQIGIIDLRSLTILNKEFKFTQIELAMALEVMIKRNPMDLNKLKILIAIIDHMYQKATRKIYTETFIMFMLGFVLPFIISSFTETELVRTICIFICLVGVGIYAGFEGIRLFKAKMSVYSITTWTLILSFITKYFQDFGYGAAHG